MLNKSKKKHVIFLPACQSHGLTFHNTQCLISMKKQADVLNFRLHVVTVEKEQNLGLLDQLRKMFLGDDLHVVPDLQESLSECVNKILEVCGGAVIHVQGLNNVLQLRGVKKQYGSKVSIVVTTNSFRHGHVFKRVLASAIQAFVYRRFVGFTIFQSSATADIFCGASLLLHGKHAGFIPLGLESDMAVNIQNPDVPVGDPDLRAAICVNGSSNFVYLANFSTHKGHAWILNGMIDPLRKNSNVRLIFAGEGAEKESIQQHVEHLGLTGKVLFPGRIDRKWVPWLISQCCGAIVGSRRETFGHNFVEPMMLGVPVIGTPTGIGKSLLMDYHTGFCVSSGDIKGFRCSIEYMIAFPEEARQMGLNAQQMVKGWTWDEIGSAYFRLYNDLLSRA